MSTSYAEPSDLDYFLEDFVTDYYGPDATGSSLCRTDLNRQFDFVNTQLRGVDTIATVPVGTQTDGKYPEPLTEWQCRRQIYMKLVARHGIEWGDDIPAWVEGFRTAYEFIQDEISDGNLIFTDQVSQADHGLSAPTAATWTGAGTFYNSYNVTSMSYTGDDFQRTYRIVIDDEKTGEIGKATFKWSRDNGAGYEGQNTKVDTGTGWLHLEDGIHVRWEPDRGTASTAQINLSDEWWFTATPANVESVAGENVVKIGMMVRG